MSAAGEILLTRPRGSPGGLIGINSSKPRPDEDEVGRQTIHRGVFFMTTLNMMLNRGSEPAKFPGERARAADGSVQGPMSQQSALGSHGYDIHPQKFVRLVGCHQSNAAKYDAAQPLHRSAA
jgi:hypothetical protein